MPSLTHRLTLLAPLRHPDYRRLFGGQLVSNLGDWLNILALITLVIYRWDLGAGAWGAVLIAETLPWALLGPVAGVWVDRWNRRTVMIVCDLARAGVVLGLVWAPNLASLLALVALASLGSVFFSPAQQATIRATVPDDNLLAANGLSELSNNAARMLGPAVGGLLVVLAGPRLAFVADSLSFLASAAILARLPSALGAGAPSTDTQRRFWDDLRDGLRHIRARRLLCIAVIASVAASLTTTATDTLGAVVLKALGVGEGVQGLSFTALGVGYVTGALVVGQWGQRIAPLRALGLGRALCGLVFVALGLAAAASLSGVSVTVGAAIVARLLVGFGFATASVTYSFILQRDTPAELMGRVVATTRSLVTAIPLAGPFVAALLVRWFGLGAAYAALGAVMTLVGLALVALRVEADL